MRWTVLFVASMLAVPATASAQQDTTPPVLLEYTLAPTTFDTGPSDVVLDFCATASDGLSGLASIRLSISNSTAGTISGPGGNFFFQAPGPTEFSGCTQLTAARFSPYGTYLVVVVVLDQVGNAAQYIDITVVPEGNRDLCSIGPCQVTNRPDAELPDSDGDGVPDDADNCPDDPNPNQEDADLDLIGDICDPFPDDRDNEQAQCEADLAQCLSRDVTLLGWDFPNGLVSIDVATGQTQVLLSSPRQIEGLGFDPTRQILYGIENEEPNNTLVSINVDTQALTDIGVVR